MSALDDARQAVKQSDESQQPRSDRYTVALQAETRAIRDALRALIQHVEELEERLDTHVKKPHARPRRVYQ